MSEWIDPEIAAALGALPDFALTPEVLAMVRSMPAPPTETPASVQLIEQHVPGPQGSPDVRVLVARPADQAGVLPALVWIHGGGYVLGSADADVATVFEAVERVGCVVVSVDYRLAPDTPHPGPIEDCYAALRWTAEHADELQIDPARIAIGGESAGGGLAAALAILARDRGEVPVVFQALVYPMLDDRAVTTDRDPATGAHVWNRRSNEFGWRSLLGTLEPGGADVPAYAAAARVTDAAGLPPAFVSVGALDLFREEDIAYADALLRAGVPTTLHVYAGAVHGFMHLPSTLGRRHNDELWALVAQALAG